MGSFKKGVVIGFAAGYVRGAKAGKERYEQIKRYWGNFQASPVYKRAAGKVDAAIGLGVERGKLMIIDGVHRATGKMKERNGNHQEEIRSTFH